MENQEVTAEIRDLLQVIQRYWSFTEDPMKLGKGGPSVPGSQVPASTVVLRGDVTLTLRYWVTSVLREWPSLLEGESLDCTSVPDMAFFLWTEAGRIAEWGSYGATLIADLYPLAAQVRFVARPPKRDKVRIGDCPRCQEPVLVNPLQRVPVPSTDPEAMPLWGVVPTALVRSLVVRHRCGETMTMDQWYERIVGKGRRLTAEVVVRELHQRLGLRYSPATVRVWAKRGLISTKGYSSTGHSLYDLREVIEALMAREASQSRAG